MPYDVHNKKNIIQQIVFELVQNKNIVKKILIVVL
jgi:hypothetical protein